MNEELELLLNDLKLRWQSAIKDGVSRTATAVDFLIKSMDELMFIAGKFQLVKGADKKAMVIACLGQLYDLALAPLMPLPLRMPPFAGRLRAFVLDVVVSLAIDWAVWRFRKLNPEAL